MYHSIYYLVSGPLAWASILVFIFGALFRVGTMMLLARKRDNMVYEYMSVRYGARSILHWLTPLGTAGMKARPATTMVSFLFHFCLIAAPVFVLAHVVLVTDSVDIGWLHIPDGAADFMALLVIFACVFFLVRRLTTPEVRGLSTWRDYSVLALVAAPFLTGFWAFHQLPGFRAAGILHMLAGEALLAAIPFTRLSHMLFFPFTRAYMGSEFGAVRHAKDW
ncbi:MAG: TmcC family electron transfer complex membrane anchor subunit [Thermodesulfobacteriota bacterium]